MPMDVQEVVRIAKDHVHRVYAEESITNVGLEEIKLDDPSDIWRITIGFSRPWDKQAGFSTTIPPFRSFKTVNIDDKSGNVVSMDARETTQAAE